MLGATAIPIEADVLTSSPKTVYGVLRTSSERWQAGPPLPVRTVRQQNRELVTADASHCVLLADCVHQTLAHLLEQVIPPAWPRCRSLL